MRALTLAATFCAATLLASCGQKTDAPKNTQQAKDPHTLAAISKDRFDIYANYTLTADLSHLSSNQRQMISLLIDASKIMDDLFWAQAYGNKQALLNAISDQPTRRFAEINYGPWDRLAGDAPFLKGIADKPKGAQFYPADMTKTEYEQWRAEHEVMLNTTRDLELYSMVERGPEGQLLVVPYSKKFSEQLTRAAKLLREAAKLADNAEFKNYLNMRAHAIETDDYQPSDMAWMDMKTNPVELVIGAIETYEDQLFGYRAAYESYVLIKDQAWSEKLAHYAAFLPELQANLPVDEAYKTETPGTDADLNAYDVVYYAGHSNAGSKTIAINLPNDEQVQLEKGTRRLQLKNAMQAKFDKILVPIAEQLIAKDQQQHITFDAFFANTMFHEVAHGLGIKNTINGKGLVRSALKETASSMEEGKADVLGLYMISELYKRDQIAEGELMDNYVTFLAGIFRSVRFGATSAHGKANMVRFNYFRDAGAFSIDDDGRYRVEFEAMNKAVNNLSNLLLTLQGNGDYEGVVKLIEEKGQMGADLQAELNKLTAAGIPVDIVFEQGKSVLGLK
ncbi:Zn-dependent hydrolase [Simiduia sp. 21SJ11W-1]|uniref:dipeptidyl-peptidase 3 family protein n=1 Tax=Simiduia sp. 21SJ11W-1 TaxID=2909669 RepID=UPI0020A23199|nr:Zn-dependent hydrolase [Simiduia sp. 21SJ11W-1]UTA47125.1 Zn-dependent hydrolase [Simiduia sp. 21SJ11W-1]